MFELFFGGIWTIIMTIITYIFYGNNGGTIRVNGEIVSQSEFNAMLFPKLFFGLFWAIGFIFLTIGIIKLIKNSMTEINGEECFGKILDIYSSNTYINGRPILKADVLFYIESEYRTEVLSESIGLDSNKYSINSFVKVKYYNGDINIKEIVDEYIVPTNIKNAIGNNSIIGE